MARKRLIFVGLIALLAAAMILVPRLTLFAQGETTPTVTPNVNWVSEPLGINVRGGPGTQYNLVGVLPLSAWVQPLGRSEDGSWILITYLYTQGWVQKTGVSWRLETDALPLISTADITPIPQPLYYNTPGGPTYTPNANWVRAGVEGAYVRSGPGQGYVPIGQLFTGDVVDAVAQDPSGDWIMIRYGTGYGWVRADLVVWTTTISALGIVQAPNLTPSFTAIPTLTRTPSPMPTDTATSTWTPTATHTNTPTLMPSNTPSDTPTITPSETPSPPATATTTPTPTELPSPTPSPTATAVPPTATPSPEPTIEVVAVASPTETARPTATETLTPEPSPTETAVPTSTATVTPAPSPTETAIPTSTDTATPKPSPTDTATVEVAPVASPTEVVLPTSTDTITPEPSPTETALPTPTNTATPEPSPTETPLVVAAANQPPDAGAPSEIEPKGGNDGESGSKLPYWLIGGLVLLAVAYVGIYIVQSANLARYQEGFLLSVCPVCGEGHLYLDEKRYRLLGIPLARRVVRCDTCRSVLRQVGPQRWRYAVDRAANLELYDEVNGRVMTEARLLEISPEYGPARPQYIEDDETPPEEQ